MTRKIVKRSTFLEVAERGEEEVSGELNNNDVEGWAVKRGIEKGLECVEEGEGVVVMTDSEVVAAQAIRYNTNWWMANEVQKVVERGLEEGKGVVIRWERRGGRENKEVDDRARRKAMMGGQGEGTVIAGRNKRDKKVWRRSREMELWQELWDGGETGRRLYEIWRTVRKEVGELTSEITQMATGHGGVQEYLDRFRLGERRERCECGEEYESWEHVITRCNLPRRRRAREEARRALGHYPPSLGRMTVREWEVIKDWAKGMVGRE